ncbi:uncharacterized protein B0H18DRAFT_981445 [Fomitopsis serialis]|uniref:uncharacterized protein n=1 Tax=Fomitopsis serialis TaxID=139415 RepID=UPI002007396E|nr:uncharacterized protein B0H18DRAFT_981445 [Neoantrodia serialis]KAH9934369.1 hypothetical protein B0H18DRAFT_981445 [Neoantrodia serialis]
MYTQGVPCGLDFSNIQSTIDLVTELTSIPVHPRHPYAGELIFTAFSGQHQDGIKKGLEAQVARHAVAKTTGQPLLWDVPYLPLDPADIGRTYEAVIRVNSQSGKGGIAYVVKERLKIDLPRAVQQDFYRVVQEQTERRGCEMSPEDIVAVFRETYHFPGSHSHAGMSLADCVVSERMQDGTHIVVFEGAVVIGDTTYVLHGEGASLASAVVEALHTRLGVSRYLVEAHTSAADGGGVSAFTSFVLLSEREEERSPVLCTWGVGMDPSAPRSTVLAVVSAVSRTIGSSPTGSLVPATTIMSWKDVMRVLQTDYRLHLPDGMHDTLSNFCVDGSARCMSAAQLAARFIAHYCYGSSKEPSPCRGMQLCSFSITSQTGPVRALQLDATIELHGAQKSLSCTGADVVSCFLSAVSDDLGALQVREVVVSPPTGRPDGSGAGYASFVRLASLTDGSHEAWGIGVDTDITTSMLKATLVSAVNASTVAQAPSSESPLGVVI